MYDDEVYSADLAFEELSIDQRKTLFDAILGDVKPKRATYLLKHPDLLGVEAEACLIEMACPEDLHRYLQPEALERLANLVNETLLARLPILELT